MYKMHRVKTFRKDERTFALLVLGCKTNQYDAQLLREGLLKSGFTEGSLQNASLCIVNSCAVTSHAVTKTRRLIRRMEKNNPSAAIFLTGCAARLKPNPLARMKELAGIYSDAQELLQDIAGPGATLPRFTTFFKGHTRAFLKVEDGCENFCSYCIVPFLRGPVKSRPIPEILEETECLTNVGFREIVLTGTHLGAFGSDLGKKSYLVELIERLCHLERLDWLRLSSIEVNEITDELLRLIAAHPKICPHLHIPLQSGDDGVLNQMKRNYTRAQFLERIERARHFIENPSITTDVMVGFPGESEVAFENTLEIVRKVGFSRTHIFPFSARPGTIAAKLPGQLSPPLVKERENRLIALAEECALSYKKAFLGTAVRLLVLKNLDSGTLLEGVTGRYLFTRFEADQNLVGDFTRVRVEQANPKFLFGRLLPHQMDSA